MRTLLTVLLTTGLPFTTCIDFPPDGRPCTALFAYGVNVHVVDADTGQPIPNAVLTLTEGDYTEVLQFIPTDTYVGAGERPGTYDLSIEVPGSGSTVVNDIEVGFDGCHVIGVVFDVLVRPGSIEVTRRQSGDAI
jgi:hypothetical protein